MLSGRTVIESSGITALGPLTGIQESDGPEMADSPHIFESGEGIKLAMPKQRGSSRTASPQADMRPIDLKPKKPARASRVRRL